jgi:hypothetical protein
LNLVCLSIFVFFLKIWHYFFNTTKNLRHAYPNYVIYISLQRMLIYYNVCLSMCSKSWLVSHYWRWPWKSRAYSTKMANVRCWIQSKTGDGHRHLVHILCKPKRTSLCIMIEHGILSAKDACKLFEPFLILIYLYLPFLKENCLNGPKLDPFGFNSLCLIGL